MAASFDSVSPSDIQQPEGKGPDEVAFERSMAQPDRLDDDDPAPAAETDDQDARGPDEGELPREDPADDSAPDDTDPLDGADEDPEGSTDEQDVPKAKAPEPPKGFASWEEATKAVEDAKAQRQWAEYGRQAYQQAHQAAVAPPQQRSEPEQKPVWKPRHADEPHVVDAYRIVSRAAEPAKALATLPADLQQKVTALHHDVEARETEYRLDPERFFNERVGPMLERSRFNEEHVSLLERVARLEARGFVQQHAPVLKDDENRRQMRELIQRGVPKDEAVELVKLRAERKSLGQQKAKVDNKARSQQAQKAANRANQAAKRGSGRTGVPAADVKPSSDFGELYEQIKARSASRA